MLFIKVRPVLYKLNCAVAALHQLIIKFVDSWAVSIFSRRTDMRVQAVYIK